MQMLFQIWGVGVVVVSITCQARNDTVIPITISVAELCCIWKYNWWDNRKDRLMIQGRETQSGSIPEVPSCLWQTVLQASIENQ